MNAKKSWHTPYEIVAGRTQNKKDKLVRKNDAMQTHQDNLDDIESEKERSVELNIYSITKFESI